MAFFYDQNTEDVLNEVSSGDDGLTTQEAQARLAKQGPNALKQPPKPSLIRRFLNQLADPMVIVLIVAVVLSGITAVYSGDSFADVIIILAVVLINAVLGVYQEGKAEAAIESLQKMSASHSKVMRDGQMQVIDSSALVPGDIVLLEAGDAVPADGRILEAASLQIEESALTGESVPAHKISETLEGTEIPLGDRKNMAYMGTNVVYGRAKMVITGTGMDTEMGKIADVLNQAEDEKTPLQIKLSQLSRILSIMVLGVCVFIFLFSLIRGGNFKLTAILDTFMIAVSLAVAAIPEGLSAVVTIVLSIGVTNMSKKNAIIRRLTAVETLGCAQIICSDKTGTLTQNRMTVVDEYTKHPELLCKVMALCCDAQLDNDHIAVGEPTECALVQYAYTKNISKQDLNRDYPRVAEAPFDSLRKMMTTVHQDGDSFIQCTKGGLDEILSCCTMILDQTQIRPITEEDKRSIIEENALFAARALRVLAAAYRELDSIPEDTEPAALEHDLIFIGFTGMIDPVRPEVKPAIDQCRTAGIRPIMITGDHRDTAVAIAKELGIIESAEQSLTGAELSKLSDEYLKEHIADYSVYARVQPEHKTRIVDAWQDNGMVVAMTGDGVNDAPSIKKADIGVGMGITGTDVTKDVADMVLADDNFATIISAVGEGRRIYDNIRKAIQFLLSSNLSEVLTIFLAAVMSFTVLKPVHLLWINLITDSIPAIALGTEKAEPGIMHRHPRSTKDGIFAGGMGTAIIIQSAAVTLITLSAYFIGCSFQFGEWCIKTSSLGMSMAFVALSLSEIFHSFNMRSRSLSLFQLKSQNVILWLGCIASLALTMLILFVPPIARVFSFTTLTFPQFLIAAGLAILIIPIVEVEKLIFRMRHKDE